MKPLKYLSINQAFAADCKEQVPFHKKMISVKRRPNGHCNCGKINLVVQL